MLRNFSIDKAINKLSTIYRIISYNISYDESDYSLVFDITFETEKDYKEIKSIFEKEIQIENNLVLVPNYEGNIYIDNNSLGCQSVDISYRVCKKATINKKTK